MPPEENEELKSMSLGDHLEELRSRLILALAGLAIGTIVCLFFGKTLIGVMSQPFEQHIQKLRETKKINDPALEPSASVQAVLVTWDHAAGYQTYDSYISIRRLLGKLEDSPPESENAQNDPNNDTSKPARPPKNPPLPLQAAVISNHPQTGFVVYVASNQLSEKVLELKEKGAIVETGSRGQPTATIVTQGPTEGFMVYMKTSMLFGILMTSPWLIWQIWSFVSAGLYRREKRYVHTVAPISGILFITGGLFFMRVVAPLVMGFLIRFDAAMGVQSFWSLQKYISMVFSLTLVFGAAFQMPIAIVFAELLGLVTVEALTKHRKFVILGIVVVSAMATPPEVVSQISLALPLYALYEASIVFCRIWRARRRKAAANSTYGSDLT